MVINQRVGQRASEALMVFSRSFPSANATPRDTTMTCTILRTSTECPDSFI